jgi:hypothetical protein
MYTVIILTHSLTHTLYTHTLSLLSLTALSLLSHSLPLPLSSQHAAQK